MIRFARDIRLIPVVLLATICLLALKVSGLVLDGGYTLAERLQGQGKNTLRVTTRESVPDYPKIVIADNQPLPEGIAPKQSWAQQNLNYGGDITGSVGEGEAKGEQLKTSTKPPDPPKLEIGDKTISMAPGQIVSAGERAILERLQERRKELDSRNRDLEMRENLLKATEKRLEAKVAELKDVEARVNATMGNRDKAEEQRFKGIVSMYENMKPKDAARILERLDMKILVDVVTQINPRKMSDILAQMAPDAAERLTVELAKSADGKPQSPDKLPKIGSKPSGT